MKKIIPFKKDIIFKTNLSEITSISLEHSLHTESDNLITGEFIISGDYRMADNSPNIENFSFKLPFDINLDTRYIITNAVVDIDDFYYEIINNNVLAVNIDVLIDKLEEEPLMEKPEIITSEESFNYDEPIEEKEEVRKEEKVNDKKGSSNDKSVNIVSNKNEKLNTRSLFDTFDNSTETYTTYTVYILREGDNIETILQRYEIDKEEIEKYNDLTEIKIGDKLIIPSLVNEKN